MRLLQRLSGWLDLEPVRPAGEAPDPLDPVREAEGIRQAMLASLGRGALADHPLLAQRIQQARDIMALWHLRADLQAALNGAWGEDRARKLLAPITCRFRGLVPLAAWARAIERAEHL